MLIFTQLFGMLCKAPRAGLDRRYKNFNYYYCFSAHPVSFLTITRFVRLFEAAPKSGSMDLPASNTDRGLFCKSMRTKT